MEYRVPNATIAILIFNMLLAFAVPAALCIFLKRKYGAKRRAFFIGVGVMVGFALLLEKSIQAALFASPVGAVITQNIWLYAIVGGAFAAVFEECGRYIAFRFWLKKQQDNDHTALMYGAGHGGFEWWLLLVMASINNLIYCVMMNTGNAAMMVEGVPPEIEAQMEAAFAQLASTPTPMFLLALLERCAALPAQLALSVLVWFSVKKGGSARLLFPLAILLHLLLDAIPAILSRMGMNILLLEGIILVMALAIVLLARREWKKYRAA